MITLVVEEIRVPLLIWVNRNSGIIAGELHVTSDSGAEFGESEDQTCRRVRD